MKKVKIGNRLIGSGEPVFIIGEAGVNHNGCPKLARKLIDVAADAKVDAIKFQTFSAEKLVVKNALKAEYQKFTAGIKESQYEMLKKLELSYEAFYDLNRYARKKKLIFLSTPYDEKSADFLEQIGVPAFKISSADITNHILLSHVAKKNKPMIVSTGMSTLGEIEEAVQVINNFHNELILLHCNFNYPAKVEEINLMAMETLEKAFDVPIGYSDHTLGVEVSLAAVALKATVIEKHFTLNRELPGPDHRASLEPDELREMVRMVRNVEKALGSAKKQPTETEKPNRHISRRSLVASRDIPKGSVITQNVIGIKRPGTGLLPKFYDLIVGRQAMCEIKKGELLTWDKVK